MGNNYTIQRLLEKSFSKNTEQSAISYKGQSYTYQELERMVDWYAGLVTRKAPDSDIVAVMLGDKLEIICAILGVVKCGKCFLPINLEYPMAVVSQMLQVLPGLILTDQEGDEKLQGIHCEVPYINCSKKQFAQTEFINWAECDEQSMLYIYFTSGTTGKSKAIAGRNIGLFHFVTWEINQFAMKENFVFSQFTPVCHDPFLRDLFTPLALGASIAVPDRRESIIDGVKLKDFIQKQNISVIHATPSLFRILIQNGIRPNDFPSLKYLLLAGERLDPKLLESWYGMIGDWTQIVNLYGPTETTLAKVFYMVSPEDVKCSSIPIGKPMSGTQVLILDSQMEICTHGREGEIYIRTPYMSLGYLDDETANLERFVKNPFSKSEEESDLLFRTGDVGRILPNGNIEILGRTDRQIKIRGYRVELDAIEAEMVRYPAVESCVVKHFEPEDASIVIVGYYVSEKEIGYAELSNHLKDCLPDYMCPSGFVKLDRLPVTGNNKIDYKALLLPENLSGSEYVAPVTEMEREIEKLWCDILKKERFSMDEDFFQGGGNSLNTMIMFNMVYEKYGYDLSLEIVISGITVRQLAKEVDQYLLNRDSDSVEMGDVEDAIIEGTQEDARYVKVLSPEGEIRVLFTSAKLTDELLKNVREKFDWSLHPHYIAPMCDRAVTLPDEIDIDDAEFTELLLLKQSYNSREIGLELENLQKQNDLLGASIMSSSKSRKRDFSAAQVVRTYVPEIIGTMFTLQGLVDFKALEKAFCDVVKVEALMRCIMVKGKYFVEFQEINDLPLPMIDLSEYVPQCREKIIKDELMPMFFMQNFAKDGALQWRAACVKLNHSETLFCICASHIIFDGFSKRVFEDELKKCYAYHIGKSDRGILDKEGSYFDFYKNIKKIMIKKRSHDWLVSADQFSAYSSKMKKKLKGQESVQRIHIDMRPIFERNPSETRDVLMKKVAYSVFIRAMVRHFDNEKIPFITISDGRRLGEYNCYNCIGEFIDYVPYLGCDSDEDFSDYTDYLTRIETEGVSILESFDISAQSKISQLKIYQFMRNIMIVYNYQYYRVAESEGAMERYMQDSELEKLRFINFNVQPKQDALEIAVFSPCEIAGLEDVAKEVCESTVVCFHSRKECG